MSVPQIEQSSSESEDSFFTFCTELNKIKCGSNKVAQTLSTSFCCSGRRRWEAFSEKLRLIISSTLRASTRSKFKIMLYVNLNWDDNFPGVPIIIFLRMPTYTCKN